MQAKRQTLCQRNIYLRRIASVNSWKMMANHIDVISHMPHIIPCQASVATFRSNARCCLSCQLTLELDNVTLHRSQTNRLEQYEGMRNRLHWGSQTSMWCFVLCSMARHQTTTASICLQSLLFAWSLHKKHTCFRLNRGLKDTYNHDFLCHKDDIKWKHFPRYWLYVRRIHRSPFVFFDLRQDKRVGKQSNSGDFRRHRAHYDITVMEMELISHARRNGDSDW